MSKKIEIIVEESGVRAEAELQENEAPVTCEALWSALKKPIVTKGIHAAWAGREIMIGIPPENQNFDPTSIPRENQTVYPIPGDILFWYFPPGLERGDPEGVWDIALIYGRETRLYVSFGPAPMNLWAIITKGLDELAVECKKVRIEGLKTFRIQRLEG